MTKFLPILGLLIIFLTACSTPETEPGTMRFKLYDQYISSWEESADGVTVHLTDDGARKLRATTRYHKGYPLEIYANRCLIQTETIRGAPDSNELTLNVKGDKKDRLIANLPAGKKS